MQHALVVEDHAETRDWMARTLERAFPGIALDTADSVAAARKSLGENPFGLAVVDINLPDGSGIDIIDELTARHPDTYCIVATIFDDDEHIFAALKAGADGYLLKEQSTEVIIEQLRGITHGAPPLSPAIARHILRHFREPRPSEDRKLQTRLTERENEVLTLVSKGYSRGEIAELLGISTNTTAGYIKIVYRKLNVSTRAEAALEAVRLGLIGEDHY